MESLDFARPFIGREREMHELRGALADAVAGRGRLVLLIGEPGIGKSRTAEEIAAVAAERGIDVLIGRCYEDEGAPALWPWVQILRAYARGRDDAELAAVLGAEAREIAQVLPEIGISIGEGAKSRSPDPDSARFRLFDAIATLLGRAARARPLVLLLDDLQGADQPSLLFLRFLARGLQEMPLLVVGTFRDVALTRGDVLADTLAELLREAVTTRISLRGFNEVEIARFMEAAAGTAPPPALVARVHERTEGNPFFVGEIVRWLVESGKLDSGGTDVVIPDGVRAAVARHLGRLSEPCAAMLRGASGFGREFRADAVARASGLEPTILAELLGEALAARLIGDVPDRPGRYRFAHAITRDTLYEAMPPPHRANIHLKLAEALEAVTATETDPPLAELSAHFQAANDRRGVQYARRAGDRALELLAYEEAVRQYESALAALDRTVPGEEEMRCDVMIALAYAQNHAGDTAVGKKTALRAAESARRRGVREQLRRAALAFSPRLLWGDTNRTDPAEVALLEEALADWSSEDSPLQVKLLARLATALYYEEGVATRRADASERAVAMARRLGDNETLAYALHARHLTMWVPGNAEQRLPVATELLHLAEAARDSRMAFDGHYARFCDYLELGNAAGLAVELESCQRLGEQRDPYQRLHLIAMRAARLLLAGHWDEATALVADLQELYRVWPHNDVRSQIGFIFWRAAAQRSGTAIFIPAFQEAAVAIPGFPLPRCLLAALYAEAGRIDEARREYDAFVPDGLAQIPQEVGCALSLSQLAEACQMLDDDRGAAALYAALLPCANVCVAVGGLGFYGAVGIYLGMLATMLQRWTEAAQHFEYALALHERMRAVPWVARTRYEYAAMLVARSTSGDFERARTLLDAARPIAVALGMNVLIAKMDALLAGSRGTAAQPLVAEPRTRRPTTESEHVMPHCAFRCEGQFWTVAYSGQIVRLKDSKGAQYLAQLLRNPGRELLALDLIQGSGCGAQGADENRKPGAGDLGLPSLDAQAKSEYRQRLRELRAELAEAQELNDIGRVGKMKEEIDFLARQLNAAVDLYGKDRKAGAAAERARLMVTKRVKSVLKLLDTLHPPLAHHLRACVKTGYYCAYTPAPGAPVTWQT
jgi:hypothetical protein